MKMKEIVKGVMIAGMLLVTCLGVNAQDETVQKFEPDFPHTLIYSPKGGVNIRVAPSPKAQKFYQYGEALQLPSNTLFALRAEKNGWYQIAFGMNEPYVSKTVTQKAALAPMDIAAMTNRVLTLDAVHGLKCRLGIPKELNNTVLWLENQAEEGRYTITLGKINSGNTLISGFFSRNVYSIKYAPNAKLYVKDSQNESYPDAIVITFGDEFAVDVNGGKQLDLTKVPLATLKWMFESPHTSYASEYLSSDILKY